MVKAFVRHDSAEAHHDVDIEAADGRNLAKERLRDGIEGMARLHEVAPFVDDPREVVIATPNSYSRGMADRSNDNCLRQSRRG